MICADGCPVLQIILHTGDMRWQPRLAEHPALKACNVELLYMDTTYCLPKHVFPSQVCSCTFVVVYSICRQVQGIHTCMIVAGTAAIFFVFAFYQCTSSVAKYHPLSARCHCFWTLTLSFHVSMTGIVLHKLDLWQCASPISTSPLVAGGCRTMQ